MIEVQNPNGLTKGIDHVMITIGVERIAAIIASDRDGYATADAFRGPARPHASVASVHRTGPEGKDLRLAA
jgi:hypothetical protein